MRSETELEIGAVFIGWLCLLLLAVTYTGSSAAAQNDECAPYLSGYSSNHALKNSVETLRAEFRGNFVTEYSELEEKLERRAREEKDYLVALIAIDDFGIISKSIAWSVLTSPANKELVRSTGALFLDHSGFGENSKEMAKKLKTPPPAFLVLKVPPQGIASSEIVYRDFLDTCVTDKEVEDVLNKAVKSLASSLGRSALRVCSGMPSALFPEQSLHAERRLPWR